MRAPPTNRPSTPVMTALSAAEHRRMRIGLSVATGDDSADRQISRDRQPPSPGSRTVPCSSEAPIGTRAPVRRLLVLPLPTADRSEPSHRVSRFRYGSDRGRGRAAPQCQNRTPRLTVALSDHQDRSRKGFLRARLTSASRLAHQATRAAASDPRPPVDQLVSRSSEEFAASDLGDGSMQ
jgi:hypothetical protein